MTLKEAREAAIRRLSRSLRRDQIRADRARRYQLFRAELPTVKLLDKQGREVWATPERCEVVNNEADT